MTETNFVADPRLNAPMRRHLRSLHLDTVEAYMTWCRENGFNARLNKTLPQRRRELASSLKITKQVRIDSELEAHIATLGLGTVAEYQAWCRAHGAGDGLASLAAWHGRWIRKVASWKPDSHNGRRQFGELARHLLAEYDVPACMDTAFFTGMESEGRNRQGWFVHVGNGHNIRKADIPLRRTKRLAHAFIVSAPSGYTLDAALRWAQIIGMGGDDLLAEAVCDSMLGTSSRRGLSGRPCCISS